ncbi:MAG: class I SAM-dependent methyltransferase [Acidimicrobiales bacterium]
MTAGAPPTVLRAADGTALTLALDRWQRAPGAEEREVLDRAMAPALDVGCGPGRHTLELASRGVMALGVDASPAAVRLARRTGAPVLERSIFAHVPGAGRWRTALLLDGNIGIGGDAVALLRRVFALLGPAGRALVEVEPPGVASRVIRARVERGTEHGPWFPWALVGADGVDAVGRLAGFARAEVWSGGGRWFVQLDRRGPAGEDGE